MTGSDFRRQFGVDHAGRDGLRRHPRRRLLADRFDVKDVTATIHGYLMINVVARFTRFARRTAQRLPKDWP